MTTQLEQTSANGTSNGHQATGDLRLELAAAADAPSAARQALASLEGRLEPPLMDDVRLLATELVSNSVRHGGDDAATPVGFEVSLTADAIRIEVSDAGTGFESLAPAPHSSGTGGWGLYLVDRLADRWGVVRERGTRVWFEIDRVAIGRTAAPV